MEDPFEQLIQYLSGHPQALHMVSNVLWVVSFPRYTAGPKIVGSCCTPLPTLSQQLQAWPNNVGSCCICILGLKAIKQIQTYNRETTGKAIVTLHYHTLNNFFYYIHFEITGDPCNLIGSQQCDLFPNRTIFCSKSHLFQIASFMF